MTDWIQDLKEKLSKPGVIELEEVKPTMLRLIAIIEGTRGVIEIQNEHIKTLQEEFNAYLQKL